MASGGELSRVMLAMKTIFQTQGITSIVLMKWIQESVVAQAIADKIYQISENSQVLCITHLPQVAVADEHYFIEKKLWRGGQKQASEFYLKRASKRNCAYARREVKLRN